MPGNAPAPSPPAPVPHRPPAPPLPPPAPYFEPAELLAAPSLVAVLGRSSILPQRPDAPSLFARARPVDGAITRGMLVCRAVVRGSFDDSFFAGGADVSMSLAVGSGETMSSWQIPSRVYTFPIRELAPGTSLAFGLVDRDVLFSDAIASATVAYTAAPFTFEREHASVECRALPSVEAQAQRALTRYRASLEAFHAPTPDLSAEDLGFGSAEPVARAAEEAASWIGWGDPDLAAGTARAREIDAAYLESVGARVVEVREALPAGEPVVGGDRALRVLRVVCGRDTVALRAEMGAVMRPGAAPRCHVVLEIEARRGLLLSGGNDGAWTLQEDGSRELARPVATRCGETWHGHAEAIQLARGERCEVHLGVSEPGALLRVGPSLVRTATLVRMD